MVESEPVAYPPQPWRLTASAVASFWLAPEGLAPFSPPPGWRPVRLAGRLAIGAAFATYEGDLAYRELVVAVLIRRGLRLAVTIPWIWVDSPASRAGARAMWAIPKALAIFDGTSIPALAAAKVTEGPPLPGRWPLRLRIVQADGASTVQTPARISTRLRLATARWDGAGAFAMLGRPPLCSVRLDDARVLFGEPGEALR